MSINLKSEKKTSYHIISFYDFFKLSTQEALNIKQSLEGLTLSLHIKGLILIGQEGINATISGPQTAISKIKSFLDTKFKKHLFYKESDCTFQPFKRMKVQLRKEIIKMQPMQPELIKNSTYLSPEAWHETLKQKKGVILDVRNWYETQIGTFALAQILDIKTFAEFDEEFKKLNIPKDQPIYTFCTGGIRCEKACVSMKNMGYSKTYQLKGGVLNYLQMYSGQPDSQWQGECFVFDHRVAVDASMQPSKVYAQCPHCGQPAKNAFKCEECHKKTKLCDLCLEKKLPRTCSKNCTYHYNLASRCLEPNSKISV